MRQSYVITCLLLGASLVAANAWTIASYVRRGFSIASNCNGARFADGYNFYNIAPCAISVIALSADALYDWLSWAQRNPRGRRALVTDIFKNSTIPLENPLTMVPNLIDFLDPLIADINGTLLMTYDIYNDYDVHLGQVVSSVREDGAGHIKVIPNSPAQMKRYYNPDIQHGDQPGDYGTQYAGYSSVTLQYGFYVDNPWTFAGLIDAGKEQFRIDTLNAANNMGSPYTSQGLKSDGFYCWNLALDSSTGVHGIGGMMAIGKDNDPWQTGQGGAGSCNGDSFYWNGTNE